MLITTFNGRRLAQAAAWVLFPLLLLLGACFLLQGGTKTPVAPVVKTVPPSLTATGSPVADRSDFCSEYRLQRERVRSRERELLREVAGNPEADKGVRQTATMKLVSISDLAEREMRAEALIKSKGGGDCVVLAEDGAATVILSGNMATEERIREVQVAAAAVLNLKPEAVAVVIRPAR